jgi:hypothetical protein
MDRQLFFDWAFQVLQAIVLVGVPLIILGYVVTLIKKDRTDV